MFDPKTGLTHFRDFLLDTSCVLSILLKEERRRTPRLLAMIEGPTQGDDLHITQFALGETLSCLKRKFMKPNAKDSLTKEQYSWAIYLLSHYVSIGQIRQHVVEVSQTDCLNALPLLSTFDGPDYLDILNIIAIPKLDVRWPVTLATSDANLAALAAKQGVAVWNPDDAEAPAPNR